MKHFRLGAIAYAMSIAFQASVAHAAIHTETVDYKIGDTTFEGFLAYDDAMTGKRPGILIAHNRRGMSVSNEGQVAIRLAKLGYVAFAADMYGKGIRFALDDDDGASVQSGKLKNDRALTRTRINAALDILKADSHVDPAKLGVMGYCVGGMVALELARSGAPVQAVAIFHGTLDTPTPEDAKNIKGRVLIMHGIDDQSTPIKDVYALMGELSAAKVNYQVELYSGVVHGFTEPQDTGGPGKKTLYNARAAQKSWDSTMDLFHEVWNGAPSHE